jgi:metallo-beta-lactamase family protein
VLFVGYQAQGTRGRSILDKEETIRMFGKDFSLRCQVAQVSGLSAHADRSELRDWADTLIKPPRQTFIVHGELESATAMQTMLENELGWNNVRVPDYQDTFTLFEDDDGA